MPISKADRHVPATRERATMNGVGNRARSSSFRTDGITMPDPPVATE
jgi:hypothetical protein